MKAEAETVERSRAWDKAKAKEKAKIARIAAEAREKAGDEARVRVKGNAVQRAVVEAVANIRSHSRFTKFSPTPKFTKPSMLYDLFPFPIHKLKCGN